MRGKNCSWMVITEVIGKQADQARGLGGKKEWRSTDRQGNCRHGSLGQDQAKGKADSKWAAVTLSSRLHCYCPAPVIAAVAMVDDPDRVTCVSEFESFNCGGS